MPALRLGAAPTIERVIARITSLRRGLRPLAVASVLLPIVAFGTLLWLDHESEAARAREAVFSTADALAEHAQKVLETTDLVLARVQDRFRGVDWQTLATDRNAHEFLVKLQRELPQIESIFLVSPQGVNVTSSRAFPFSPIDVGDREYYRAARAGDGALHISAPFRGAITGSYAFAASRPRISNGQFDGVIAVTISPSYFETFYRGALKSPATSAVALVRADGAALVRFPALDDYPDPVPATSPLWTLLQAGGPGGGVFDGKSRVDGHRLVAAYRWLPDAKLAVVYSLDRSTALAPWRMHAVVLASCAVLLMIGLLLIERLVFARTTRERDMLRNLVSETERRQRAEAALTQMQKMEALGRLTGGVAHDFNNLLAAVLGSLELALKRVTDERILRLLRTASDAAQRGARLTAQMLAFSRKHDIVAESVDPNRLVRGMDDMLRRSVGPLVRIHYELAPECWPVLVDSVQLEVALLNLAVNARDAMPLGGTLVFRSAMLTVTAEDAPANGLPCGDYVRIDVQDSGVGMTEDVRARAFEPFYTTKGPGKGTGLGLSMVYGYVTQIGGTVTIDGALDQGTTISLFLPRAPNMARVPDEAAPAKSGAPSRHARVLVVDDDNDVRESTRAMVEDAGHAVVEADGGVRALEILGADRAFDAVLLDFAMPVMNGGQVAEEIMRNWPDAPIVFVTGYVENDVLQPWLDRGFRTLRKPFKSAEVAAVIEQMIVGGGIAGNVVTLRT